MSKNNNAYYPCSICGWNSPLNVVTENANGQREALCPIHNTNDDDDEKGKVLEKKRDKFKDEFRKAFVDINKTEIGDITV